MSESEYICAQRQFLTQLCLPQLRTLCYDAQKRYDFLCHVHTKHREAYGRLSYWNSLFGLFVSILSAVQQLVLVFVGDVGGNDNNNNNNSSRDIIVTGFVLNTVVLVIGLIIRQNAKTIKDTSSFTQSLNEQLYTFADCIQELRQIIENMEVAEANRVNVNTVANHSSSGSQRPTAAVTPPQQSQQASSSSAAAACILLPSIQEMEETVRYYTESLQHMTFTTSKIIEVYDTEVVASSVLFSKEKTRRRLSCAMDRLTNNQTTVASTSTTTTRFNQRRVAQQTSSLQAQWNAILHETIMRNNNNNNNNTPSSRSRVCL